MPFRRCLLWFAGTIQVSGKSVCLISRSFAITRAWSGTPGGLHSNKVLIALLALLISPTGFAQFDFSGKPELVSGPALQQGALYRYSDVGQEIDALVEVVALNNASLVSLEQNYPVPLTALQMQLDGYGAGSYVELRFTFVDAVTFRPLRITATVSALGLDASQEFLTLFDISDFSVERSADLSFEIAAEQAVTVNGAGPEKVSSISVDSLFALSARVNAIEHFTMRAGVNGNMSTAFALLFDSIEFADELFVNVNDKPVARNDYVATPINTGLQTETGSGVLANDEDIDIAVDGDKLFVTGFSSNDTSYSSGSEANLVQGSMLLDRDGSYSFTPAVNYTGVVEIDYTLEDAHGSTDGGTLEITVGGSDTLPIVNNDIATLNTTSSLVIAVLGNDSAGDGNLDPASLAIVADMNAYPAGSSLSADRKILSVKGEGLWRAGLNGLLEFTPDDDTSGNVTPIRYRVADDSGNYAVASVLIVDGMGGDAVLVSIDEDRNDDGYISDAELVGEIDVTVELPPQAMIGDGIVIGNDDSQYTRPLTADDLTVGAVSVTFSTPVDGTQIIVEAYLIDQNGNQSLSTSDSAVLDITPTDAPEVSITADSDNSGFISSVEHTDEVEVEVTLPATAVVNDTVSFNNGTTTTNIVLGPVDIANGIVSTVFSVASEGQTLSVLVQVTDSAGNRSPVGSDSALIDTVAPGIPFVTSQVTESSTPTIRGGLPFNRNYILTVEVNGVTYSSGDGRLSEGGDGTWRLTIPALDRLDHGIYDVVATVLDMAGNSSTDITSNELEVDLVVPVIDAVSIGPSADPAPVLSGTTDQSDETGVRVTLENGRFICDALVVDGRWSCRPQTVLLTGENNLVARIGDAAGNTGTAAFSVSLVEESDVDGDGIPDSVEGTDDFDGDGISNHLDADSDNDSISDLLETAADRDGDGIRNFIDIDSDNDGLVDSTEARLSAPIDIGDKPEEMSGIPADTDLDSIADYLDHDSDNDGLFDFVENNQLAAQGASTRADGQVDSVSDFDRDGVANYLDLDSDGDGISDLLESNNQDENGDGRLDKFVDEDLDGALDEGSFGNLDWDNDGSINALDHDSDADGKSDLLEAGGVDVDNNGLHDSFIDTNGNSIDDAVDSLVSEGEDEDKDGIDDRFDIDFVQGSDSDFDGIADEFDFDANGDGIADLLNDTVTRLPDTDGDGQPDVFQSEVPQLSASLQTGTGSFGGGCVLVDDHDPAVRDYFLIWLLLSAVAGISRRAARAKWSG